MAAQVKCYRAGDGTPG